MKYTILLKQHIGAPLQPVTAAGDAVKRGQLLAVPNGLGAPLHSPFSGTITALTDTAFLIDADEKQPDISYHLLADLYPMGEERAVDVKGTLKCENPGNCPGHNRSRYGQQSYRKKHFRWNPSH